MNRYLRRVSKARIIGMLSGFSLVVLAFLTIFPIVRHEEFAEAAYVPSTSTLAIVSSKDTASVDVTPTSSTGTFVTSSASDQAEFTVTTNNLTGYSLNILGTDVSGQLVNTNTGDILDTISSDTSESDFRNGSASLYSNKWGYRLNINNTTTTDFIAAPTTATAKTIYTTSSPNTTSDNYKLGIGARVDYTKPSGTYTNTFVLTAVGNPVTYEIEYQDTTGDSSVTNFPSPNPDLITTAMSGYTLSTTTPTRTGYSFAGWCESTVTHTASANSSCSGTTYAAGASYTFSNPYPAAGTSTTLKAMWNVNKYTCTKQYRLQDQDGNYPSSYTPDGTEQVALGTTCTYDKTITDYNNNTQNTTTCTVTTDGCTASLDFPRNTYTLTVSKGSNISSVSGGGTYRWGQSVSISATPNTDYIFSTWTISGAAGTLANAGNASTTYTMPIGASTVTASGIIASFDNVYYKAGKTKTNGYYRMQDMTTDICSTVAKEQTGTLIDTRSGNKVYTVGKEKYDGFCIMKSNLDLPGNTTIYNTDSNITASSYKLPASSNSSTSFTDPNTAYVYNSNSTTCASNTPCYSYYSYRAAIAGSSGSDICPKGWQLINVSGGQALGNNLGEYALNILAGTYSDGSFGGGGNQALYWVYNIIVSGNRAWTVVALSSNAWGFRPSSDLQVGGSVRCMAK